MLRNYDIRSYWRYNVNGELAHFEFLHNVAMPMVQTTSLNVSVDMLQPNYFFAI